MFFRRAETDDAKSVVIGALREHHHIKACIDQTDSDEADFAIIEPVIFALKRRVPIEIDRRAQRNAVLGPIYLVLG